MNTKMYNCMGRWYRLARASTRNGGSYINSKQLETMAVVADESGENEFPLSNDSSKGKYKKMKKTKENLFISWDEQ